MTQDAIVHWRTLRPQDQDDGWYQAHCLYACLAPRTGEILYIGKSVGTSMRQRWNRGAKQFFWEDLGRARGLENHAVMIGEVALPEGGSLSRELLADIESVLIHRVRPWGNIMCRKGRTVKPRLTLSCRGAWPLRQKTFRDSTRRRAR
jgi:hypothetical protein